MVNTKTETVQADLEAIPELRRTVYAYYESAGRTFAWRKTDPWGVLVSEFMLQQTQTERVVRYFDQWMRLWSSPQALSRVSLAEALRAWSGLGYNRRCRYLKECAEIITERYDGIVPNTPEELRTLPGIGAYTAGAIAAFAYNYPAVFIETNIRAALIHFFFTESAAVPDSRLFPILAASLDRDNPRRWYWALMDYGAYLKKTTVNPGRNSSHYVRQSPFIGSFRQIRGKVIRSLVSEGGASIVDLHKRTGIEEARLAEALAVLEKETFVSEERGVYRIKG
jgi:A/G-specific adenine glycosylase